MAVITAMGVRMANKDSDTITNTVQGHPLLVANTQANINKHMDPPAGMGPILTTPTVISDTGTVDRVTIVTLVDIDERKWYLVRRMKIRIILSYDLTDNYPVTFEWVLSSISISSRMTGRGSCFAVVLPTHIGVVNSRSSKRNKVC